MRAIQATLVINAQRIVCLKEKTFMTNGNAPDRRLAGDEANHNKTPYHAPVLRVYGAVSQLTRGQNGTNADGQSGMAKRKF
jgi:hypothetical protein